ncbi:hypothetical protein [Chitinophaga nivalis]|uniref:YcxB-like protein domain-containing protein n=1 Tax=Chitinophaga nivalis TaxID=2991709 RepID=A0ABT3IEA3_9BACT|nr:hypothetical protein [Chitinophaga nivalis]MCW3468028.1 hypothetical protein [Chitinophaga nivalis]MCW3482281.1 hypothetical protein [Chitinophaga nivalis]
MNNSSSIESYVNYYNAHKITYIGQPVVTWQPEKQRLISSKGNTSNKVAGAVALVALSIGAYMFYIVYANDVRGVRWISYTVMASSPVLYWIIRKGIGQADFMVDFKTRQIIAGKKTFSFSEAKEVRKEYIDLPGDRHVQTRIRINKSRSILLGGFPTEEEADETGRLFLQLVKA